MNRGIRKGRVPRATLRQAETFNYILDDLSATSALGLWLIKNWLKDGTGCLTPVLFGQTATQMGLSLLGRSFGCHNQKVFKKRDGQIN